MIRLLLAVLFTAGGLPYNACCQTGHDEEVSKIISQKMKDSLALTNETAARIYRINMQLAEEKRKMRNTEKQPDRLTNSFQRTENQRDSLYKKVLSKKEFERYEKMKTRLISVN